MRWLLPRVLPIAIILIAAIGATMLIGRWEPIPADVAMLHLQDCQLPCWIGIIPGKTTVGQARRMVEKVYGADVVKNYYDYGGYQIIGNTSPTLSVAFNNDNQNTLDTDVVEKISLWENQDDQSITDLPIGQILPLLDPPNDVNQWGGEGSSFPILEYSKAHIIMSFGLTQNAGDPIPACTEADLLSPLLVVDIYGTLPDMPYQPQPWRGFSNCYDLGQLTP